MSFSILSERNRALSVHASSTPLDSHSLYHADLFSDVHWISAQKFREACDSFESAKRWHVVILPSDNVPRSYFLVGDLQAVTRRAKLFFPEPITLAITPAAAGLEHIDTRLHLAGKKLL